MINSIYFFRSKDGRILVVSSTDGYCSIVTFGPDELGRPYSCSAQSDTSEVMNDSANFPQPNLPPSFQTLLEGQILQENVQDEQQPTNANSSAASDDFHLAYEDTHMTLDEAPTAAPESAQKSAPVLPSSPVSRNSPRRVQLITLSSPKQARR